MSTSIRAAVVAFAAVFAAVLATISPAQADGVVADGTDCRQHVTLHGDFTYSAEGPYFVAELVGEQTPCASVWFHVTTWTAEGPTTTTAEYWPGHTGRLVVKAPLPASGEWKAAMHYGTTRDTLEETSGILAASAGTVVPAVVEAPPTATTAPRAQAVAPKRVARSAGRYLRTVRFVNRPCRTEDQRTSCYWRASSRGNGRGTSFVVTVRGVVQLLDGRSRPERVMSKAKALRKNRGPAARRGVRSLPVYDRPCTSLVTRGCMRNGVSVTAKGAVRRL